MMLRAETYTYDECRVVFLQSASEPHEILVASADLVLTRVELAPCGLEEKDPSQNQEAVKKRMLHRPEAVTHGKTVFRVKCETLL